MRLCLATITAGLLLLVPATAFAQESGTESGTDSGTESGTEADVGIGESSDVESRDTTAEEGEDEVGIGGSSSVECRGTIAAGVVDLDGAVVPGAVLNIAGEQVSGAGTVDTLCGEVAATLLVVPDGYAAAGPTTQAVQVRLGATTSVTFAVDPVEVLGTVFEQPATPAAPTAPAEVAAPELAATGPVGLADLLLAALVAALLGTLLVGLTPPAVARP